MKISEVQPSSRMWADLKSIDLELNTQLEIEYRQHIQAAKTMNTFKKVSLPPQWNAVLTSVNKQISEFNQSATNYQLSIKEFTSRDSDLRNRYRKVERMKNQLDNMNKMFKTLKELAV